MPKNQAQTANIKQPQKAIFIKSFITILVVALIVALGLGFYFNRQKLSDFFAASFFKATPELAAIDQKIQLTNDAHNIFYATQPSLNSRDDFNAHCNSHNDEISILGCYTGGKIYIYNIEDTELSGIIESTATHELLHAVWERLDPAKKSELTNQLVAVYNDERYRDALAKDLESYAENNRIDELHSRIGTEIADLPEALEKHYANYFKNQDLVVDFYHNYITPFNELSEEIDNLSTQLEKLSGEIDQKSKEYYQDAEELSSKIDEFNNCAKNLNCFGTEASLLARRNSLLAEQSALNTTYDELAKLVDQYNAIVEEYNNNIIRSEELETKINSNKKTQTIK